MPRATASSGAPSWILSLFAPPVVTVAPVGEHVADHRVGRALHEGRDVADGVAAPARSARRRHGPAVQRLVERGLQLVPDREVRRERDDRHGEADGEGGQQDHPAGQRPPVVEPAEPARS